MITAEDLTALERYQFTAETEACPVCGADGPCAVDTTGRPMVHTDAEVSE